MTDGISADANAPIEASAPPPPEPVAGAPDAVDSSALDPIPLERPPRPGDLTVVWRLVTATTWIAVAAALAAVWNASVQLGLATWWLGPRSDQQPVVVRLLPFVPSVVMLLAAINQVRRLAYLGLIAAAAIAIVGIIDLSYVRGLGLIEIGIAGAAAVASIASLSGTYRSAPHGTDV